MPEIPVGDPAAGDPPGSPAPAAPRVALHDEMEQLERETLETMDLLVEVLARTMEAVQNRDTGLAEVVIADDDRIDGRYLDVHQGILSLIARQAPVAGDLRLVAALLHVIVHVERIGDLCVNIAKLVPLAAASRSDREDILVLIGQAGEQARSQIRQARRALAERDPNLAEDLVVQDDTIDELNRQVFDLALEVGEDIEARHWASNMMLASRYIERIGDHTVDIGEQTAFVVTGEFREFTDASTPGPARI